MNSSYYRCNECEHLTLKWMGKCPRCSSWNTLELKESRNDKESRNPVEGPIPMTEIEFEQHEKIETEIGEFDRVLGGGVFPGGVVLLGGDPGIGKSTLMLQVSFELAKGLTPVYYLSGEESPFQLLDRCKRLNTIHNNVYISSETNWEKIEQELEELKPGVIVVDSIQSLYFPNANSLPGSLKQVKECSARLVRYAKDNNISCFIVGHVTKVGDIAGPKVLEHMVDTVLSFEGEKHYSYRILRSEKNRFGPADIGVFEMKSSGLYEVNNPSMFFLDKKKRSEPGSCITASMEGKRPVLVEIQSLTGETNFASPRRMTSGLDHQRVSLIIAVLEKKLNLLLGQLDIFVNVVGGLKLSEPSVDLAVAISLVSSYKNKRIDKGLVAFGEVGLTGEVREIANLEQRLKEAKKLGYKQAVIPKSEVIEGYGLEIIQVRNLNEVLDVFFE